MTTDGWGRRVELRRAGSRWQVTEPDGRVIRSVRGLAIGLALAELLRDAAETLDRHIPLREPCGLCGSGKDQTHRVIDAVAGHVSSGDDPETIADDYGLPVEAVAACVAWVGKT